MCFFLLAITNVGHICVPGGSGQTSKIHFEQEPITPALNDFSVLKAV